MQEDRIRALIGCMGRDGLLVCRNGRGETVTIKRWSALGGYAIDGSLQSPTELEAYLKSDLCMHCVLV